MKTLSFENFVASKVEMTKTQFEKTYGREDDLSEDCYKVLVYADILFIEVYGKDDYYLALNNMQYSGKTLEELEQILYDFGLHQYYVTEKYEKMNVKDTINKMFFTRENYVSEIRKSEKKDKEIFYIKLNATDDIEHQVTINRDSEYVEVKLEFPLSFLD